MLISALLILRGLKWNHLNISKRTGKFGAAMYSLFIYTFSLLSWFIIAIFWAEWTAVPLVVSIISGGFAISRSQKEYNFKYHSIYFCLLSAFVPIITLPSLQEPLTKEKQTKGEIHPLLQSNQTSASNLSESSTEGLRQRNVRSSSVNESDSLQQQPTTNTEKNTPGNSQQYDE
jgi:hypothetical protein